MGKEIKTLSIGKPTIKAVAFDLDGVLVDTKNLHYEALNNAIRKVAGPDYIITKDEHLRSYDGLSTRKKLEILKTKKKLPKKYIHEIQLLKQKETAKKMGQLPYRPVVSRIARYLHRHGIRLFVTTNSTRKTARQAVRRLRLAGYVSGIISNEDVKNQKPHPEIYLRCMVAAGCRPEELLVIEDSPFGMQSAAESGAKYIMLKNPKGLTLLMISQKIGSGSNIRISKKSMEMGDINVLIPMAGEGKRFAEAGYSFPKPLIEIPNFNGKSMIQVVVNSLGITGKNIFVVQARHRRGFNLDSFLGVVSPGCKIVSVDKVTEGAACTCLLAKPLINNEKELIIANSDQYLDWKPEEFIYLLRNKNADFGILTFTNNHPKWSYAKTDEEGRVLEVAEKKVISDQATVGVYYWKHGRDFVRSATEMIEKNLRVGQSFNGKGEFYVCPSFNELIAEGARGYVFKINKDQMYGLGTPEDLKYFIDRVS